MISYVPPALAGVLFAPAVPSGCMLAYAVLVAAGIASVALFGLATRRSAS